MTMSDSLKMMNHRETIEQLASMLKPDDQDHNRALLEAIARVKDKDETVDIWIKWGIINSHKQQITVETISKPQPQTVNTQQLLAIIETMEEQIKALKALVGGGENV